MQEDGVFRCEIALNINFINSAEDFVCTGIQSVSFWSFSTQSQAYISRMLLHGESVHIWLQLGNITSCLVCWHFAANFLWRRSELVVSSHLARNSVVREVAASRGRQAVSVCISRWGLSDDRCQTLTHGNSAAAAQHAEVQGQITNPCKHFLPFSLSPTCQSPTLLSPCSPCSPCSPLQTLHPWR